jgi:transcriptional regulator with XRE-family HTH domain
MGISPYATDSAALDELGSRLRRHRIRRDLTQKDLAHEAGVSVDTVKRVESGRAIGTDNLLRVLRALGLLEALGRAIPAPPPSPLERLALQGAERQRVRHPRAPRQASGVWRWGDEDPPRPRPAGG